MALLCGVATARGEDDLARQSTPTVAAQHGE
jgi:hypothetical protein